MAINGNSIDLESLWQLPSMNTGGMSSLQNLPSVTGGDNGQSWLTNQGGLSGLFNNSGIMGKTMPDGSRVQGWGMPLLGGIGGLMSAFNGYKTLGLAKDQFNQSKKEFDMNWGAQQKTVNARLEDRQRARVASNPGAYKSVDEYMQKNGI